MSLIELVVVSMILVILTFVIYATFTYESEAYRRNTARTATLSDLRIWMARMVKDIRNANYDPLTTAGAAIGTASPTDFEFTTDYDKSGAINTSDAKESLGYRLPTGSTSLQLRQGSASNWRTVVTGVTSLNFTYWDYQGRQVNDTSPYTSYQDISEVRISITATSDTTTITETGRAFIRNPNSL